MKFHKSSLKLAGLYLAILMTISLFFSGTIYQVSINELDRGLRRPTNVFMNAPPEPGLSSSFRIQFQEERLAAYEQARDRIIARLTIINLLILLIGGVLSYYLALRTLKPIEDAHEAQSRFASNASHELRTPITAMRTENEVALMDPKLTLKDAKRQLQSNVEELEKLTRLAEGLLRLAQLDNIQLGSEEVAIDKAISDAIKRVENHAQQKDIKVVSPKKVKATVLGDGVALTELFVTILDNAIKYSPSGATVTVAGEADQHNAKFMIQDHGQGIADADLPHIFDRFYRADDSRTKQSTNGYGLGLSIAKGIADMHNGTILVDSQPGKGSVFTITIPVA